MQKLKLHGGCFGHILGEWRRWNRKTVIIGAALTLLCGIFSAAATFLMGGRRIVYLYLTLPPWAPPSFVFPLIWSVVYIAIGGAAGAVWGSCGGLRDSDKYKGLLLFVLMMIFNFIWCPLFFVAYAFFIALFCVAAMGALTVFTIKYFKRVNMLAAAVMAVYLCWLGWCFMLNLSILLLN